jgi:hypothetical protein
VQAIVGNPTDLNVFKNYLRTATLQDMSDFTVDLQDPESVATALGRAQQRVEMAKNMHDAAVEELERAQRRERDATAELDRWRALAVTLQNAGEIMAAVASEPDAADADPSSKARALQVVTALDGPTNVAEVAEHMQQFNRKTVGWALWKLAQEGAIQGLGNGRYAPTGYTRPGTALLDALALRKAAEREP